MFKIDNRIEGFGYVTHHQCEEYRKVLMNRDSEQDKERSKLWSAVSAAQTDIKHLINSQKWFNGIVASVLGGLIMWLINN